MDKFKIVEKKNHLAVHALCNTRERAECFLKDTIRGYITRGYFMDKTLKADDFEIIKEER